MILYIWSLKRGLGHVVCKRFAVVRGNFDGKRSVYYPGHPIGLMQWNSE